MVISPVEAINEVLMSIQHLVSRVELFIGGFFGLYLIYYVFSYFNQKKSKQLLVEIRDQLRELNKNLRNK